MKIKYTFQDCLHSELKNFIITPGTIYFCRDTGEAYYDTLEGIRLPVSRYIRFFEDEQDRLDFIEFDSEILYIVRASSKAYIYNGGWICINPDMHQTYYFDIDNIEVPLGHDGRVVSDSRITTECTGEYVPLPSIVDVFKGATVTCTSGYATIKLDEANTCDMIGVLKIGGRRKVN